jgi:hypothetical protein
MRLPLYDGNGIVRELLITSMLLLMLTATANAQHSRWHALKNRKLITFDWNCAHKESFPNVALSKIVYDAIKPDERGRLGTWGDRAFAFSLRPPGALTYFVPTVCGATGNCTWRLYTVNPVRYLGEISGQFIYTYKSSGLPIIVTYSHMSASEGILSTYVATDGRYRWPGEDYPIDAQRLNGHSTPTFLERAARQCKDYGG